LEDIKHAIREDDEHEPITRLVCLENTHNRCGGIAITAEYTWEVGELVHAHGIGLHIDGARIFNAAVTLGITARELVEPADSVTFCLSKALCAPVGSVLCGSRAFISRAHRIRKQLGGGMRQAGILAAAGIAALETMVDQLSIDHLRARRLAQGLGTIPGLVLDPGTPFTNMVYLSIEQGNAPQTAQALYEQGVRVGVAGVNSLRLVTHYWIDDVAIERTVDVFQKVLTGQLQP
jgi:threonine aldolase